MNNFNFRAEDDVDVERITRFNINIKICSLKCYYHFVADKYNLELHFNVKII